MMITAWIALAFLNGIVAFIDYKCEKYKSAIISSWACGFSMAFLIMCF